MEIDWGRRPDEKALGVFRRTLQDDDRDFNDMQNRWPEPCVELNMPVPNVTVLTEDYEDLPDLNPITSTIRAVVVRAIKEVEEKGVPAMFAYNGIKALVVAGVAFVVSPGELEEKTHSSLIAGAALLGASPTFYAAGIVAVARTSVKAWKSITSPKP
jgi:hypothetical protein